MSFATSSTACTWLDQQRRELERALSQTNLDARDARIAGDIEAATVKLRSEFDVAGDKLRDEFNAATSKLHDEINTRLARLPLEVKTWEPVGEALDQIRQQAHEQARSELHAQSPRCATNSRPRRVNCTTKSMPDLPGCP